MLFRTCFGVVLVGFVLRVVASCDYSGLSGSCF